MVDLVPFQLCNYEHLESFFYKILAERHQNKQVLRSQKVDNFYKQEEWFNSVLQNSSSVYFIIFDLNLDPIGYCGLDKIQQYNRTAEISIFLLKEYKGKGYGTEVIDLVLEKAFKEYNLNLVYAESYMVPEGTTDFWKKNKYFKQEAILTYRKYWNNEFYHSAIFSVTKEEYYNDKIHS